MGEGLLKDLDQEMAERGANESTVDGHLGDARGEVVAMYVAVLGDPGGEDLLQSRQSARGEHLGP